MAARQFNAQVADTMGFLQEAAGEDRLNTARIVVKQGTERFDSFMKQEYESAKENLRVTNQLLVEKLMSYASDAK